MREKWFELLDASEVFSPCLLVYPDRVRENIPPVLEITAETDEGEIMGVKHQEYPIWGVQFHPESILTQEGRTIVKNFLKLGK